CRLLAREGVDLLKLNLSGDLGTSAWSSELTPMSEAEVAAAMEVARARELRVCAHCRSGDSVRMAVKHGIEIIYHANYCDEAALDALESARDRVFVAPALGITYNLTQANGQWGVTPERAVSFERELASSVETIGRMRRRGIRVLPGGDYGFVYTPHGTYARDLWLFVKLLGYSPLETLVAATRRGGGGRPRRSPAGRRRSARRHRDPPGPKRDPHDHEGRRAPQEPLSDGSAQRVDLSATIHLLGEALGEVLRVQESVALFETE